MMKLRTEWQQGAFIAEQGVDRILCPPPQTLLHLPSQVSPRFVSADWLLSFKCEFWSSHEITSRKSVQEHPCFQNTLHFEPNRLLHFNL